MPGLPWQRGIAMKAFAPIILIFAAYLLVGTLDYQDAVITEANVQVAQR